MRPAQLQRAELAACPAECPARHRHPELVQERTLRLTMMRLALDTNLLAYAEGVGDAQRCQAAHAPSPLMGEGRGEGMVFSLSPQAGRGRKSDTNHQLPITAFGTNHQLPITAFGTNHQLLITAFGTSHESRPLIGRLMAERQ